jgi:putative ABC transport system permease protein
VRSLRQILAVVGMNLRSMPQRLATSLVIVIGIAGVVAVLISVLSLAHGLAGALDTTGRPDRAVILHSQAIDEVASSLAHDDIPTILDAPGIAHDSQGRPIASAEMLATVSLKRRDNGLLGTITLRGVSAQLLALRPELHLTGGRMFRTGLRELIAGGAAAERFRDVALGSEVKFGENTWHIVGTFSTGGGIHDSELIADADTLLAAYRRTSFNSVIVKLDGPTGLKRLRDSLEHSPTVAAIVRSEPAYYAQQSQTFARLLSIIAHTVAVIMAIGAVFAALNTMYSAVSARTVEIATLRAIGFGATGVVVSVMTEALLLALLGAGLGVLLAWVLFDGNTVSTVSGGQGVAQVVFHLRVGLALALTGVVWACAVGLLGGLLPAIRAARLPVASALRAV